jgi:hypothetical protein
VALVRGDPAIKKAVVASPAPRLLKDLVLGLWSFKSRGAAQAPKIIIAKIVGARLPELHVFFPRLLDIHACKPSSLSCQDFFSDIIFLAISYQLLAMSFLGYLRMVFNWLLKVKATKFELSMRLWFFAES